MLSTKTASVLNILVNQYVQTAIPVASDDIARLSPTKVSSSTVRNAMSQLAEEGYISRPHVSAGGIPSDLGYRHYLESIEEVPELPVEEIISNIIVNKCISVNIHCKFSNSAIK